MTPPTKLQAVVTTAGAAGVVAIALTLALAAGDGWGSPLELVTFTVALGLTWAFPLLVLRRDETEGFQFDEAFLVAMALLMPPLATVTAFAVAASVSQLARRRPLSRVVFNTGMVTTAAAAGVGVVQLFADHGSARPAALAAAVGGAFVFLLVNASAVWAVLAVVEGQKFREAVADGLGFRLLVWVATVSVGLLAGLAGSAYSWALLLALIPLGALQVVLSGSLRARIDRQRIDGLLRAALGAHASVDPDEVEEAVCESARQLLACRAARISDEGPGPDELGCPVSRSRTNTRWLVVSDPRGAEPLGERDAKLLGALAAVATGALENAALVEQIRHQVFHDTLTGLPNQALFDERARLAIPAARRSGETVAVLVLDLDGFKRVNDSLGHHVGNVLLQRVAERLAGLVGPGDTVARLGGDEFTVLLTGLRSADEAEAATERILESFSAPFDLGGRTQFVTASIGLAVTPEDGHGPSALLKNADAAMYRAKDRGRNCYEAYSEAIVDDTAASLELQNDLHHALDRGELRLVYQPQVDLESGRVVALEALARWDHPDLGAIPPSVFVPLAEESGLILLLDDWVLQTACRQATAWAKAGLPAVRMAVNLSGRSFQSSRVAGRVADALHTTGLPAGLLELEVTESMAIDQGPETVAVFSDLESLGVRMAIDDFGTGYSALSRLEGFPCHTLKIDRSFLAAIERADAEAPIVAAMIAMAHALGLEVVAEGVETSAQWDFLRRHRCDVVQGYLFSPPVDPVEVEALLLSPHLTVSL